MNAVTGQVNPSNAPRDAEKLQLLGPFMLKRLMEQGSPMVGVNFDEATRNAFFKKPINERAQAVLELLKQIDAGGGAPTPTPAPMAPAAATAPVSEEKPARTPVSRNKTSNGAATNGAASHTPDDGIAILKEIAAVLGGVSNSIDAMAKAVKSVESGAKKIESLDEKLDVIIRMQHLQMGVLQQVVQNSGPMAPMADILEAVKQEYGEIEETITALISGK